MHETAGVVKLVNAALLSLINKVCVCLLFVCCVSALPSSRVHSSAPLVCSVQARSNNPRGRACRPSGKGSRQEGILSDVLPVYLYCPAFSVSVSLGV